MPKIQVEKLKKSLSAAAILALSLIFFPTDALHAKESQKIEKEIKTVEVEVFRVVMLPSQLYAVLLKEKNGQRIMPIFIGDREAEAIQDRLLRQRNPRPMTHSLLEAIMKQLGAKVEKVVIDDLKNNTFLGRLYIRSGDKVYEIDARPSDSIVLAVGANAPIFAAETVVEQAKIKEEVEEPPKPGEKPSPPVEKKGQAL